MSTNHIFPALVLVMMALAIAFTIAALALATARIVAALWMALNPPPGGPRVNAASLAPIFDLDVLGWCDA